MGKGTKTKEELLHEIKTLRKKVTRLKNINAEYSRKIEELRFIHNIYRNYESLIQAMGEVAYEYLVPKDNIILLGKTEKIFGNSKSKFGNNRRNWSSRIHPKDLPRVENEFSRSYKENQVFDIEYRVKHKSGKYMWVHDRGIIHIDNSGNLESVIGVLKNITEYKQSEKDLRDIETRYKTILENTGVATVIIEGDNILSFVNKQFEKLSGYKKEEIENKKNWTEFFVKEDLEKIKQYYTNREKGAIATTPQYEFRFKNRNGMIHDILLTIAMIPETKKSVASLLDITTQRQLEKELGHVQRLEAVGQLIGGVAHDFNNVLTIIQGNAQLVELESEKNSHIIDYMNRIKKASKKAASLTKQLLLFSRKEDMVFEPLALNQIIDEMLKMLKRIIGEDITIKTDLAEDLWYIEGNEGNLEQVIMNLAVNARDAMPKGGSLFIKTKNIEISEFYIRQIPFMTAGKYVCLIVEDTGTGMNKEIRSKIFDPFFTTKHKDKGTGLGLSVVYGIVKKHKGWIHVYSEKNAGATFKIYIPAKSTSFDDQKEKEVDWEKLQGKGEHILLIEDDPILRELGKDVISRNGYQVDDVGNAIQALNQFKNEKGKYDLVISDVVLPDMNAVDLVTQLNMIKGNIPVIMTSGYTEEKSKRAIIKKKNYPFIQKPFNAEKILDTIKKTLRRFEK